MRRLDLASFLIAFILVAPPAISSPARPATKVEIEAVRAAMQRKLKDADSAKFLQVEVIGETVCGQVNGKNELGAYVGFRTFFGSVIAPRKGGLSKTTAVVLTIAENESDTIPARMCRDSGFMLPPGS